MTDLRLGSRAHHHRERAVRASGKGRALSACAGFTLLEAMVAFLVLSVGLMGLAGLQLTGVKNGRDAYYRSQAILFAYDIADRMRANQDGVSAGDYHAIAGASQDGACENPEGAGCTPAQLAAEDVNQWRSMVSEMLPSGDAIVCLDSTPDSGTSFAAADCDGMGAGDLYVAKVWWGNGSRLVLPFVPE